MEYLLEFWFKNDHLWFNASEEDDILITNKFEHLLLNNTSNNLLGLINTSNNLLGLIILHDQISRHIYRKEKANIKFHDSLAYNYCIQLLPNIENYNCNERCFILMPLRHTFNPDDIKICLEYIAKWRTIDDVAIYRRFYQASINSLIKINNLKNTIYLANNIECVDSIYDNNSIKLLDSYNFNIIEISNSIIYKEFCKNIICDNDNITISISGGVDSMVCSLLLYIYCLFNKHINPVAICINYKNRESQDLEVEMVARWLEKLNITFHVRNIEEIKRSRDKDRDFYEKTTRDIRFDIYKKLNNPVILGHNRDDTLENIFSNLIKRKNYDNLLGMTHISLEKTVTIMRPLLNISKKEIIEFATIHSIPYVFDSTPSWSERGKMRDILIPQIANFDTNILDGLFDMANNYVEIYKIYNNYLPNIIFETNKCIIEDKKIFFFDYWQKIFIRICNYYKLSMIKNKSINYMINNIQSGNKITLNKHMICQLEMNITIFLHL